MSSLNRIILVGKLAFDPDAKVTTSGDPLVKFKMNVDRPERIEGAKPQFDSIQVIAWREAANKVSAMRKGDILLVEGRVQTRSFDDQEGKRRWITEVEARTVQPMLSGVDEAGRKGHITTESLEEKSQGEASLEKAFDFGADAGAVQDTDITMPPGFGQEVEEDIPF
ncbi:single-stranded DNA-binding protein [Thermoproteota archaeon]